MLTGIILCLFNTIQYPYRQDCWLISSTCRYIPLKQWALDDSHSPKYQKFKTDGLPLITDFRRDWAYKDLVPYYERRYDGMIRPISHRPDCHILDDCSCPRCDTPKPLLYKNSGPKGQLLCKICDTRLSPDESCFLLTKLRYPHHSSPLVPKKDRRHSVIHECVNPKCPYYLHSLKKTDNQDLKGGFGENKYKLYYIYRELTVDFSSTDLSSPSKNASFPKFDKHNAHAMSLALILYVNLGFPLGKTSQVLEDLYNISLPHQQIANYYKAAAIYIKPFVDQYPYEKGAVFTADGTYIKIRGTKIYIWLIMNTVSRSTVGYQVSDNHGAGPCILATRMALQGLIKLPENPEFIADGYSAYPLTATESVENFGKPFTFHITQMIGLTNNGAVSKEYHPSKQMIERLNYTYRVPYRHTNGFDNIDDVNYELAPRVAYYNFFRPHEHNQCKVLNGVEALAGAGDMPGEWQSLIFLGQQTILNIQKNDMLEIERDCCQ